MQGGILEHPFCSFARNVNSTSLQLVQNLHKVELEKELNVDGDSVAKDSLILLLMTSWVC